MVVALPLLSASGGNLDNGQDSERPRRWKAERVVVQELAGHESGELAILRNAITLRLSTQENTAYLTCPVARLARNAQGQWRRDPSFIPPMLSIAASPSLVTELGDLLIRLQARRKRLMAMRRESNARLADFAVADVSLFWLLNALNSAEPVLTELLQTPGRHPELLWRELTRLAGSLLTFSLEHDAGHIPAYQHDAPERVFPPLLTLLDKLLEASLPSWVISIQLELQEQIWKGSLHDARLREGADFYLSVRSSMPNHELQTKFPLLCKAGTYGEVYHYLPRHLERGDKITPSAETGNFWARFEHERFLSGQTAISGCSNDALLSPGQVLTISERVVPPTLPSETDNGIIITRTGYIASRKDALIVMWEGMPYYENRCWRPAAKKRPVVSGTLTARVTSAKDNDIYAWQDASGMYRVKFDADRDDKRQGMESMPVRFAKPYGGDKYGFHFPLIQGTEVAIAFHECDPDRPYIAHALHDSRHVDHVTEANSTRNVIRTAGLNKLRMEDKRGEEHVKLSTEYGGKTQLNLGHNVDASRKLRGEGAELRTDDWVSIRGGKGIFISADNQPDAQGQMLDMNAAIAQLQGALQLVTSLAQSASASGAMEADMGSQQQLGNVLIQLKEAGLLASAPAGIGLVTPKNIQLSAGHSLTATAGENVDISIMKKLTLAAGEAISLFAQRMGISIFSARGKVDIQAQTDAMRIQSDKIMNINSVNGEVVLNGAQGITLTSKGGAYIKIKDGAVEIGAPGKIDLKSTNILWGGSASLEQALSPVTVSDPEFHNPMNGGFQIQDQANNQPKPYIPYRIETEDGLVIRGVTDENGCTQAHYGVDPKAIKLFFE